MQFTESLSINCLINQATFENLWNIAQCKFNSFLNMKPSSYKKLQFAILNLYLT